MSAHVRPPRALVAILRGLLPDGPWSAEFVDELGEAYARVADRRGRTWATLWYAVQVVSPATLGLLWRLRRRRANARGDDRATRPGRAGLLEGWTADLAHAGRVLRREPRFAAFAVLTLALGVGANAAVYGIADRLFLRGPEHVRAPEQLVRLYLHVPEGAGIGAERTIPYIPYRTANAMADGATGFQALALYRPEPKVAVLGGEPRDVGTVSVGPRYFDVLGVVPAAGRFFGPNDVDPTLAVLGHQVWTSVFGAAPDVIGRRVEVGGAVRTVIGVAPEGFSGPHMARVDFWLPLDPSITGNVNWYVIGRLPADRTSAQDRDAAAAAADAIHHATDPGRFFQWALQATIEARPLGYGDDGKPPVEASIARLLLGVVAVVLLVACANVVNLLLARLTRRRQEVAVRLALGAGRWRLVRLLLTETVLLAVLGGVCALPLAHAGGTALRSVLLPDATWASAPLDPRVLVATLALTLACGLLVGVLPARFAGRTDLLGALRFGPREGGGRQNVHAALAGAQVALSAALLVCAGLFLKSFWTMRVTDLGFAADDVAAITFRSLDPEALRPTSMEERAVYLRARDVAAADPGIEGAAVSLGLPVLYNFGISLHVPGVDSIPGFPRNVAYFSAVTDGYFRLVGTPIVRGRAIDADDVRQEASVMVVSETTAESVWPGEEAIGKCAQLGGAEGACWTVVGVAADVHRTGYREPESLQFYVPLAGSIGFGGLALIVRPRSGQRAAVTRLAATLEGMDPAVDLVDTAWLRELYDPETRPWRLGSTILVFASILALAVSLVGVYGVLAYLVAQRRTEIGVRIALGASRSSIRRLVLRTGLRSSIVGMVTGAALVLAASRWLGPMLFETSAADPLVLATVGAVLLIAASLACAVPAGQAARVEPVTCLKSE